MAEDDQERTEDATDSRREDFRKRGQVAYTKELASVFMLLASAMLLWGLGRFFLQQMVELLTNSFGSFFIEAARRGDYVPAVEFCVKKGLLVLAPMMGILSILGIASSVVQTGLLNNEEALELNFDRLNPVEGLKRLITLRAIIEGVKSIFKIVVLTSVVFMMIKDRIVAVPNLIAFPINQIITFAGDLTVRLLGGVGVFLAVIAAADYFYQRWELEKQMRMTKQEIKEEHKSREGDPMIKARIRRIQREMANKRMITDVPKATVIVTNPTHIACALQYDPDSMAAPRLIAKGAGVIAEGIKEIARENNIPVMENKPLARAIFKTLKVGHTIPRELFTAVAQVLSYVYKLKRKATR